MFRNIFPSVYDMVYSVEKGLFVFYIRKQLQDVLLNLNPDLLMVESLLKKYGFSWAGNNPETGFGFIARGKDHSPFTFSHHEGDSIVVTAEVPSVASEQFEKCQYCNGTGSRDGEDACFACQGKKVRPIINYGPLLSLAATIHVVFNCGWAIDYAIKPDDKQRLIDVTTMLDSGFHGASLGGNLHEPLMRFLHSKKLGGTIEKIVQAMHQAYSKAGAGLWGEKENHEFTSFYDRRYHHFYMRCPGNACEVGSEMYQGKEIESAKFNCHNTDTMTQQICFLAGLGTLCGAARKAGF